MGDERATIDLDDDDIDIASLVRVGEGAQRSPDQNNVVKKVAEQSGFVSRTPTKMGRPRTSPYTSQFGGKCRPGMKALFHKIGETLDCQNTRTLELAIEALIEKQGLDELLVEYQELIKRR